MRCSSQRCEIKRGKLENLTLNKGHGEKENHNLDVGGGDHCEQPRTEDLRISIKNHFIYKYPRPAYYLQNHRLILGTILRFVRLSQRVASIRVNLQPLPKANSVSLGHQTGA